ncbi:MAG: hypothetical protein ABI692_05265 [Terracoccus sp.]
MRQGLRDVGVARYDAFGDLGGRLCVPAAIGDRIVISSVHTTRPAGRHRSKDAS